MMALPCSVPMEFSSVNDFLKKAASAKEDKRHVIDEQLSPLIEDEETIGVPYEISDAIADLERIYGDEAFKQVGMYCLARWFKAHAEVVRDCKAGGHWDQALTAMDDASKISTVLNILKQINSFDGNSDWRTMLKETITQAIIEKVEENGANLNSIFNSWNND
jgi:hypothetical protein